MPQGTPQVPLFNDLRQKIIVFPDVQANDTIVYTTELHTKTPFFPEAFFDYHLFWPTVSYGDIRVTITAPSKMELYFDTLGAEVESVTLGNKTIYKWHYNPPPTIFQEDVVAIFSVLEIPRLLISTFRNYDELAHAYAELALPKARITPQIEAMAAEITSNVTDRHQQAKMIYKWVSRNIRYVSVGLGVGSIVPHAAELTLTNRYGDCKDKATLLAALLAAKGIESELVLINSGNSYGLSPVPGLLELNHAINWLPEFDVYLDTTAEVAPYGTLPFDQYGKPAIHVVASGQATRQVPVLEKGAAAFRITTMAQMDWNGRFAGSTSISASGPYSITLRDVGLAIESTGLERTATAYFEGRGLSGFGEYELAPANDVSPEYTINGRFDVELYDNISNGKRFPIYPGYRFLGQTGNGLLGDMYAAQLADTKPTPCVSGKQFEELSLSPPPGMVIGDLPEGIVIENDYLKYRSYWERNGRIVKVTREFESDIDEPLCSGSTRRQVAGALNEIRKDYENYIWLKAITNTTSTASTPDYELNELTKLVDGAPKNAVAYANKGFALAKHGEINSAIVEFTNAIRLNPRYVSALIERGRAYATLGDADPSYYEVAATDFSSALEAKSNSIEAYRLRGIAYARLGKYDNAIDDFTSALSIDPQNASIYLSRAPLHCELPIADVSPATACVDHILADLNIALSINPDEPRGYVMRALLYLEQDNIAGAGKDLDKAKSLNATGSEFQKTQARYMLINNNAEDALEVIEALLDDQPTNPEYLYMKAGANFLLQRYEQALSNLDAALTFSKDSVPSHVLRAEIYGRQRKYSASIAEYNKAIALQSSNATLYESRGVAYHANKEYEKAISDYKRALELDPRRPNTSEFIEDAKRSLQED